MHAGERIFFKNGLPDFMHFLKSHLLIGGIFYRADLFALFFILPDLSQKYTMPANGGHGVVFLKAFGNKRRWDGSLIKYVFYFPIWHTFISEQEGWFFVSFLFFPVKLRKIQVFLL